MQAITLFITKSFHYFQNHELSIVTALVYLSLILFLLSWLIEPRKLINGILFTAFFLIFMFWFGILIFSQHKRFLNWSFGLIGLGILFLVFSLVIFSWAFFLWNAYFVWKYENHTLPNLLTLILGIGMMIIWTLIHLHVFRNVPDWINVLLTGSVAIAAYLLLVMYNFLINLLLYQIVPRHYKQNYLIVLGAGLIDGKKVSRILGARIDRAIAFYNKQYDKGKPHPKFIMSGGKGQDEDISEAQAMKEYAISHGVPANNILLEEKSRNTYENMLFSKSVAIKDYGSKKFRAKFFTNNYHLFRAGLYARMAGLHANGVGSTTRFYYLPNATIREFVGIFMMHKKRHFIIIGLIAALFVIEACLIGFGYIK